MANAKGAEAIIEAEKYNANIATPPAGNHHSMSAELINLNDQVSNLGVSGRLQTDMLAGQKLLSPYNIEQGHFIKQGQVVMGNNHNTFNSQLVPNVGLGVSDDDFFHLTCHIDPNLIAKIEKGEFVELEKLLPKDRAQYSRGGGEENRLEWVQRDGNTFLVSAGKDAKITGIRRWEQAFRAYATIYCAANPHRSKEIWQYIAVINTAASAYSWDNVYNYDITSRHLMAFNPNRSWAVTYNQMWNLSLRDPLPKNQNGKTQFQFHHNGHNKGNNYNKNNGQGGQGQNLKKKPDYCWNFQKGIDCRYGKRCRFIERCSYCDSPNHGVFACKKLEAKSNGEGSHKTSGSGSGNSSK